MSPKDRRSRKDTDAFGNPLGSSPDEASGTAEAEEARAALAAQRGADVDERELEQQALHSEADLDDDGDIDDDDREIATTRARRGHVAERPGGPRFVQFLRASWTELRHVQWPDRMQVAQGTAVVLGFVLLAGAYLGAADVVAQQLVKFILR